MSSESSRSFSTIQHQAQQQQPHSKRHISHNQGPTGSKNAESNMDTLMKSFDYELNMFLKENKSLTSFMTHFSTKREEERNGSQSFNQVLDQLVSEFETSTVFKFRYSNLFILVAQRHFGLANSFGRVGTCERTVHQLY